MKVFWSWQSDTPGKTGRHFVRAALAAAIEQLKQQPDVIEPTEREVRDQMHLDQDRQGIPGSPDLPRTILEKIQAASVVVADVTQVGEVTNRLRDSDDKPKKLINSNVAVELGYALNAVTERGVLMVMNDCYGTRDDLPFDLRQKAGPIIYSLAPDATRADMTAQSKKLTAALKEALELCLTVEVEQERERSRAESILPKVGPATFFKKGEILATAGLPGEQEFRFNGDKIAYLMLQPVSGTPPTRARMTKLFEDRHVTAFVDSLDTLPKGIPGRNSHGPIIFEFEGMTAITGLTQGFSSGALWGVNGKLIGPRPDSGSSNVVPIVAFERLYTRTLKNYVAAAKEVGLRPPLTVVLGIVGVKDALLGVPTSSGGGAYIEKIFDEGFQRTYSLASLDDAPVCSALQSFFEGFYDLASCARADLLTEEIIATYFLPSLRQ